MDLEDYCPFCRDFFEDELRAFQGAEDGFLPCVWDIEVPAFAQVSGYSQEFVSSVLSYLRLCSAIHSLRKTRTGLYLILLFSPDIVFQY